MPQNDMIGDMGTPEQNPPNERTYTQSDVDNIIGKVKSRIQDKTLSKIDEVKAQAINEWRESNGLTDDILNQVVNRDAHKLEISKRDSELKKVQNAYSELEKKYTSERQQRVDMMTRTHVFGLANRLESNDPDTVYLWLRESLAVDDEGSIYMKDGSSVEDAVKKLLNDKPHLRRSTIQSGGGNASGGGSNSKVVDDLKTPEGRKAYLAKQPKQRGGFGI